MKRNLNYIQLTNFTTESGYYYPSFELSYQTFGLPVNTAPVVLREPCPYG
ncbi:MAG: hypothetical protein U5K51_02385 [Flavobacteriaceae bacterium]|nr:hypothetical protein [Flavobacteriaceae bacterium]